MGQGQNTVYHFFIVSKGNLFQETFTVQNENESLFCLKVETKIGNVSSRYLQNENESIVLRACRFLNTRLPCTCYYFHLQIMEWIKTVLSKRNWLVWFYLCGNMVFVWVIQLGNQNDQVDSIAPLDRTKLHSYCHCFHSALCPSYHHPPAPLGERFLDAFFCLGYACFFFSTLLIFCFT